MYDFQKGRAPLLCVLGLGSNRSCNDLSCVQIINNAAAELQKIMGNVRLSPLYKTEPLYVTDQPPFINAAVSGFFPLSKNCIGTENSIAASRELLALTQKIEAQYGRDRSKERRWGERTLDIDILLFGDLIIEEKDLSIPHPLLKERAFALRPLLDLLPDAAEPGTGELYARLFALLSSREMQPL